MWLAGSLAVLAASLAVCCWQLNLRGMAAAAFLALAFVYQPLFANMQHAQAYVVLLGLLVLAWHGYRRGRPWLLGGALGLMLVLKTAAAMLWLLPAAARRWRAIAVGLGVAVLAALAALPWIGPDGLARLPAAAGRPQRPAGNVGHRLSDGAEPFHGTCLSTMRAGTPRRCGTQPALGLVLAWVGLAALLAASGYATARGAPADLCFALFAIASVVLSPVSLDYHYTLLLVPVAILLADVVRQGRAWQWAVLAGGAGLIAASLPYNSPRLRNGALALLAYPKLYGALLLWALAWWAAMRSANARPVPLVGAAPAPPYAHRDVPQARGIAGAGSARRCWRLLLVFWGVALWNLDRFPPIHFDEATILEPGYQLFYNGVYGSRHVHRLLWSGAACIWRCRR